MKKILFLTIAALAFLTACNTQTSIHEETTDTLTDVKQDTAMAADNAIATSTDAELYVSADGQRKIFVHYFEEENKRYVGLTPYGNKAAVMLEQIPETAFAKGADYGNNNTKWQAKGDAAVLIENGTTTHFVKSE